MSFFFRKRTPRGPPPAHCKTCKARLDACTCTPTDEESYEERRARTPPSRAAPEPAPADESCEDATPRLDAAAERRLESVYAAYVADAARANAGARLQESDAPPISCFGEDAFCMAHTGRSVVSGVVDYQSMATRNRLDGAPGADAAVVAGPRGVLSWRAPTRAPAPGAGGAVRGRGAVPGRGLGARRVAIRALGARKVANPACFRTMTRTIGRRRQSVRGAGRGEFVSALTRAPMLERGRTRTTAPRGGRRLEPRGRTAPLFKPRGVWCSNSRKRAVLAISPKAVLTGASDSLSRRSPGTRDQPRRSRQCPSTPVTHDIAARTSEGAQSVEVENCRLRNLSTLRRCPRGPTCEGGEGSIISRPFSARKAAA